MKKCPNCGAACSVDSHFCSRCGMVLHEQSDRLRPSHRRSSHSRRNRQSSRSIRRKSL